jgi:hypothetical protein
MHDEHPEPLTALYKKHFATEDRSSTKGPSAAAPFYFYPAITLPLEELEDLQDRTSSVLGKLVYDYFWLLATLYLAGAALVVAEVFTDGGQWRWLWPALGLVFLVLPPKMLRLARWASAYIRIREAVTPLSDYPGAGRAVQETFQAREAVDYFESVRASGREMLLGDALHMQSLHQADRAQVALP